jgi:predicted acetyltransferase
MSNSIMLAVPGINHKEAAQEFIEEFRKYHSNPNGSGGLEKFPDDDYEGWLGKLEREGDEKTVDPGKVPASTFFAIRREDQKIVGMINLRRRLNDYLLKWGGHVGYCVRPTERRKGYASEMLCLALGYCGELGLEKTLVTCNKDNIPSAKIIQRNGGVLENEAFNEDTSSWFQRYWIETAALKKNSIIRKILSRTGNPGMLSDLETKMSMSEITTLLLEVFRTKTQRMKPAELLRQYEMNRFVKPSELSPVLVYRFSADLLEMAEKQGYSPLELSPVTVLGSCSVVAQVDQNKVLSALRGTEVVSDAANALALSICALKNNMKNNIKKSERLRYCAVHRHIRTQKFQGKNQFSHFILYGMVISGADEGNFKFEKEALWETFAFYHDYLSNQPYLKNPRFIVWPRRGENDFTKKVLEFLHQDNSWDIREEDALSENNYYQGLQFKIKASYGNTEYEIGDGGFVDWPQKLIQNHKERMLISALGLERLVRMSTGLF